VYCDYCCNRFVSTQLSSTDYCQITFALEMIMLTAVFCKLPAVSAVVRKLTVCWPLLVRVLACSFFSIFSIFFLFYVSGVKLEGD